MAGVMEEVRAYIVDNFLMGANADKLTEDKSFLDLGIIDSTGIIELIAFIEDTWGIRVEEDEMIPENLDRLRNIERYVESKLSLPLASSA